MVKFANFFYQFYQMVSHYFSIYYAGFSTGTQ